jgi:site-specific DNA-methyltransferase (adenine-specific)
VAVDLLLGDCLDVLPTLADASVDSIVTDPPYELGFMGKGWDRSGIANSGELWCKALRVLKPGGHLLAFSGSRTYHRMVCAIEDAGFEIRDQIMWVYGSGFPKSHDVSKGIDKAAGAEREVTGRRTDGRYAYEFSEAASRSGGIMGQAAVQESRGIITTPATLAARQWQGWGTALKPAHEPIVLARKPLEGTVAANVLKHGTGGLNIDGCRVAAAAGDYDHPGDLTKRPMAVNSFAAAEQGALKVTQAPPNGLGRWPANIIHDGSDEVMAAFPEGRSAGNYPSESVGTGKGTTYLPTKPQGQLYSDSGSAARFFYCAKASKKDRGEGNTHPTVKPTDLMRYLCRLVTPPGGTVLDPFMGSGSTGRGAVLEGFNFIGIEREAEYHAIAERRIDDVVSNVPLCLPLGAPMPRMAAGG